jgi:hypothetical protein
MPRWNKQERYEIQTIRTRLKEQFESIPDYPEVMGDRKIVRFLRGHNHDLDKVAEMMGNYVKWWKANNVGDIRNSIVEGRCDHPLKFPKGAFILSVVPQLVLAPPSDACVGAVDKLGSPVCVDQYNFSPVEVLQKISIEEYILFVTYCLEYRTLVLEQMSEEKENAYLASLSSDDRGKHERIPDADSTAEELPPHGVLVYTFVIRDLTGVGIQHLGAKGQEIMKAVISIGSDNYPEMMRKCMMINTPWVFNTIWYFVKGLIAQKTLEKISVMGSVFQKEIAEQIGEESIPAIVGGPYTGYREYQSYPFNRALFFPNSDAPPLMTVFTTMKASAGSASILMSSSSSTSASTSSTMSTSTSSTCSTASPSSSDMEGSVLMESINSSDSSSSSTG